MNILQRGVIDLAQLRNGRFGKVLPVVALFLLAAGVQTELIRSGRIHWNSDQAVVAIMARDILTRGAHPVFYYGSAYAGSLEPHWVSLFFAFLGPTVKVYRVAMIALLLLLLYAVYRTARARFGRPIALISISYLAVPPYFFFYKGLTSDGAYDAVAILGGCILYASFRLEDALRRGRSAWLWVAALGGAAGMGWWVDPLIICFYIPVLMWFLIVNPSVFLRFSLYPLFIAMCLLSGFPWWINNLRFSWHSLTAPELAPAGQVQVWTQMVGFWKLGLPIVMASRPVYDRSDTYWGESTVSLLLYLIPCCVAVYCILRKRRGLRGHAPDIEAAESRALLLPLLTLVSIPSVVCLSQRSDLAEPRYLFPLYAGYPIVFAYAVYKLLRSAWPARSLAILLIGMALFSSARGLFLPDKYRTHVDRTMDGSLADLIDELQKRDLKSVYASYWVAYRIAFESGERLIGTPFGEWRLVRITRYQEAVSRDPRPAIVLYGAEAGDLARYLHLRGAPFQTFSLGPFRVFYGLDAATLQTLRQNLDIPKAQPKAA